MECRIRKHDDFQFEVKVSYPLNRERPKESFRLDVFAFLPYTMGITPENYPHTAFYEDLRTYTRFKTPVLELAEIADPHAQESPLRRMGEMIREGRTSGHWDEPRLVYEMKSLAVMARVQTRENTVLIRAHLRAGQKDVAVEAMRRLLDGLAAVTAQFRSHGVELGNTAPAPIRAAFRWSDEYLSVEVETYLIRLVRIREKHPDGAGELEPLLARVSAMCRAEAAHRRKEGYPTVVAADAQERNEYVLYRQGLLKKFCSSVLFLSVAPRSIRSRVQHTLYAVAAALAMTLGVFGLWLADHYYHGNMLVLGLVAVIVYVVRDRLKDLVRNMGLRLLPRWVSDRNGRLVDPQTGRDVGVTRETALWRRRRDIPSDVLAARRYVDALERAVSEPTEVILHYDKSTYVRTRSVYAGRHRSVAVDDILRLRVGEWLRGLDNPEKTLRCLEEGTDAVKTILARRVYRVNLVVRLQSSAGAIEIYPADLVLSQKGIERIEREKDASGAGD